MPLALRVGVVDVAVAQANVDGVEPTHVRALVAGQVIGGRDGELLRKSRHQSGWNIGRVVAKRPGAADGGELHGVAEARMISA